MGDYGRPRKDDRCALAGCRDQMEEAAGPISSNIWEVRERGTHEELLTFLYYALGSTGEVRSMLLLIQRLPGAEVLRSHWDELLPMARAVSRQLSAWIESLKSGAKRSPRQQDDVTRNAQVNA